VTVKRVETVEEVLRTADVVSLHCNLDADTKHLMNKERLNMMKVLLLPPKHAPNPSHTHTQTHSLTHSQAHMRARSPS
jgi:hypothetical protein